MQRADFPKLDLYQRVKLEIKRDSNKSNIDGTSFSVYGLIKELNETHMLIDLEVPKTGQPIDELIGDLSFEIPLNYSRITCVDYVA